MKTNGKSIESLFGEIRDDSLVCRTEDYARWSLPTIYADPQLTRNGKQQPVRRDFQSVGAILVNQLSAKITSTLFPTQQNYFRINSTVDTDRVAAALAVGTSDLASGLSQLETDACSRVFLNDTYQQMSTGMKLLIVTGNVLLYRDSAAQKLHAYSLRQYAVRRDGVGTVWDIVLKEAISPDSVPDSMAALFRTCNRTDNLKLFTWVKRVKKQATWVYEIRQEIEGHEVLDSKGKVMVDSYPEAICPYIPVCWNLLTGENMGRGLVEDYAGDFAKLSELSEALALYEIEACRVLHFAKSGGGVDVDSVNENPTGSWVSGDPSTIEAYESGDYNKINALVADIQSIFQRLAPAFMYGQNMRDGERVTAAEVQQVANNADEALGGVYSSISAGLHIPLANILCWEVKPEFINELIKGGIKLSVVTGVAALGRSTDVGKLMQAAQAVSVVIPAFQQAGAQWDANRIAIKILEGFGLDPTDYQHTEEELQASAQQAQAQAQQAAQPMGDPMLAQSAAQVQQAGVL